MGYRLSKIYTRTGDDGTTGLGDGSRVPKDDARVEAYGTVDELNSALGLALAEPLPAALKEALAPIQHELFDLGGELSIPGRVAITAEQVSRLEAILDTETKLLKWTVTFENLTGAPTAAHFHGPADPGENAGPVVPATDLESPMEGEATLDDAQIADLEAGKWYFNIHTAQHPDGEIRGQVKHLED